MTAIANKLSIAGLAIAGSLGVGATGASAQAVYVDPYVQPLWWWPRVPRTCADADRCAGHRSCASASWWAVPLMYPPRCIRRH
jgi:hypothetical protein